MNWKSYLESVCRGSHYAISRQYYTPLDALDRRSGIQVESPFLLDLRVRTVQESGKEAKQQEKEEKVERLGVLEGLRRYAAEHVLLVGRPGSGKTIALQRLLVEEAEKALSKADTRIPVLLELRHYRESTLDLIELALQEHGIFMDPQRLHELLQQSHLLLLADGINELPSEAARRELEAFRRGYRATTPMIFTTRELAAGGDLGIGKRLAMEPLTEPQMQQFVRTYLNKDGDKLLRQLQGRLRELAGVPLLLWMLCSLFQGSQKRLPENLGLALRQFTSLYDHQIKDNAPVSKKSRRWWPRLLQRLAFMMLQGPESEELYVAISRPQAEDWLAEYLREEKIDPPRDRAMDWLTDLLNHHLLQRSAGDSIEFRHQFIQEYYAAEYLLHNLPKLDDVTLQRDYLNYLKWTEPLTFMLGLVEDRNQALRVVKLAAEVDWKLAARLAGAVRLDFQQEVISFIARLQIPEWHRVELYGLTRSVYAIPVLDEAFHNKDPALRGAAAEALGKIGDAAAASTLLDALRGDKASGVRWTVAWVLGEMGNAAAVSALQTALGDKDSVVRQLAAEALGKIGNAAAVSALQTALRDDPNSLVRWDAAEALGKIGNAAAVSALRDASLHNDNTFVCHVATEVLSKISDATAVSALQTALGDQDSVVRQAAAQAPRKIGNTAAAVSALQTDLRDQNPMVRELAAEALGKIGNAAAVSALLGALRDGNARVRWDAARVLVLERIGDKQLLAKLVTDFRKGTQTNSGVLYVITSLQERFKVYRTDTFWSANAEIKLVVEKSVPPKILRVVLASPGDVQPERDVLPGVIDELNRGLCAVLNVDLKLDRWETDTYPGFHPEGPQGLIDPILRIDDCDVLIGIFWHRFGTPTKDAGSGTEHEFRTAYEAWQRNKQPQIMVYFKRAPYSPSSPEELDQWRKVLEFQKAFPKEGLWWPFKTTNKFRDLIRQHLSGWVRDNFKQV